MEEVRAPLAPDAERSVRTAVIGNFVDIFGLCTILPLIPFFVKDVGAPKIWVGLISGAQFLGCCLGNFTWGQVGDRRDPNAVALGLMVGDAVFFALTAACTRAGKGCEIPNFKGSYLGHFPLVLADFWTSDHLSERSRSVGAVSETRARGTLMLKRR